MPKISQLPTTTAVTDYDVVPISQGGAARSASIGTILESVQPVINLGSPSLLGRTSLGPGGPEQVEAGLGLSFSGGTLCANGDDHATFPCSMTLVPQAQIVMTSNGTSMLMPAALLRGLFLAGENVSISSDGVIAASGNGTAGITDIGSTINHLQVTTKLAAGDLIPVSQAGAGRCVSYANLIGGLTIDQAQAAAATSDTDTMWVGQTSNIMVRQTFAAIWSWIAGKLPTYELPVIEVTTTTTLNRTD